MGLVNCIEPFRWIVFLVNLVFWIMGIIVLALGLWLCFDSIGGYTGLEPGNMGDYYTVAYILIAAGVVMTVLGFLGCCGALMRSQIMLTLFFILVLFFIACEFAAAILAWMYRDSVRKFVENHLTSVLMRKYGDHNPKFSQVINEMQERLECCGVRDAYDWPKTAWSVGNTESEELPELGLGSTEVGKVPVSCCNHAGLARFSELGRTCGEDFGDADLKQYSDYFYQRGCMEAVTDVIRNHLSWVIGILIPFIAIQLFGMVFSMLLCCLLSKKHDQYVKNDFDES